MSDLSQQESLIDKYIKEDNKEAAVKLLFDLIVSHAKKKDFTKAEALRDRLYEVDSMALNEIIKSSDIIEQEKSESIDQDHRDIWSKLYDTLSTEEANALYFAMKEGAYDPDQAVFEEGDPDKNLYFINKGELKMIYTKDDNEVLLKNLGPGDIAGEDPFFSNTAFSTVSLITLSGVTLNFLDKDVLIKWRDKFSGLEPKLHDYCSKLGMVHDLLDGKNLDRRIQKRVNISGRATIQLFNPSGGPSGKAFVGTLSDISVGGLSFFIKISKKETARLLLGRKLNIKFILQLKDAQQKTDLNGTVVGVRYHTFADHSIHIKFDKQLSEKFIEGVGK
ncbi:MAG: cyclic nucleotide-binding domain-containing protein [Deltaproteobacteria bacterium]|nr:cyclic nucleotide-binding domain-containing protein [Deltaproteobacteria bacterium]